jgi:hypothetical protein
MLARHTDTVLTDTVIEKISRPSASKTLPGGQNKISLCHGVPEAAHIVGLFKSTPKWTGLHKCVGQRDCQRIDASQCLST